MAYEEMRGNESRFTQKYTEATNWMLDALAHPSAPRWLQARLTALQAIESAFGDVELHLARRLLASVMEAAKAQGYTGLGE